MRTREPSRLPILLTHAAGLARLLLKSAQPPRALVSTELHRHKRLSPDERQFISAAAFHALRNWRFARACAMDITEEVAISVPDTESRAILAASVLLATDGMLPAFVSPEFLDSVPLEAGAAVLLEESGGSVARCRLRSRALDSHYDDILSALSDSPLSPDREQDARRSIAIRCSLPGWVVDAWREQPMAIPFRHIARIGQSFARAAPLTLRVNRVRDTRENLLATFSRAGIPAAPHPLLPDAIVLAERAALLESEWYRDGRFEIQDAGSQLIGLATGRLDGLRVLDACAGGGGKTMQMADAMHGTGTITACDIERAKLRGLEQRVRRLGLTGIDTRVVTPDTAVADGSQRAHPDSYDLVLVDAPCSGFGTVRRNPAHKWRLTAKTVRRLADRQAAILARNAAAVRTGGSLLYATCSLLPHENSAIIDDFLRTHPHFHPEPLAPHFDAAGLDPSFLAGQSHALLLLPDLFDSDGFYMARLRAS